MKKRSAFALPLVLTFLLIGGALITASLDIATKSQEQSMRIATTQELYNAAQSGLEWGKTKLLEHRDDVNSEQAKVYNAEHPALADLYATYDDGNPEPFPTVWDSAASADLNQRHEHHHIQITVEILDCNYTISGGTPDRNDDLPPLMTASTENGNSGGGTANFANGTTVIMDPNRVISSGSGGTPKHYYLIRSTANDRGDTRRTKTLEAMVVING